DAADRGAADAGRDQRLRGFRCAPARLAEGGTEAGGRMSRRMQDQHYTVEDIAAFAIRADDRMLSDAAGDRLKRSVLDGIGGAIAAIGAEPVRAIRTTIDAFGGQPLCTLIGGGHSAPDRAALYNGCLVRYLDFMDNYALQGE